MGQFVAYLLGICVAFFGAAILTYIVGFEDLGGKPAVNAALPETEKEKKEVLSASVTSPVAGQAMDVHEVKAELLSSGPLRNRHAVQPEKGDVPAPEDCVVSLVFPTRHAIGLTLDNGAELLIHIGMNTVELNGEHFEQHVEAGTRVAKGTKIVSFDVDAIKAAGYDVTVPVIVSNSDEFTNITVAKDIPVDENTPAIFLEK